MYAASENKTTRNRCYTLAALPISATGKFEVIKNSIGNLTLLDAPTNRGYGNAPFVVKRTKILEAQRLKGTFILPCTRDLFLKVFSENPGNLRRWDIGNDGAAHETAICKTLQTFFGENGKTQP